MSPPVEGSKGLIGIQLLAGSRLGSRDAAPASRHYPERGGVPP